MAIPILHHQQSKSYSVELFDKGRGPGGRLATRTMSTSNGEVSFDYGTQYFTAADPAFLNKLNEWISEGLVAPWPAAGVDAYVGTPAMSAPVSIMAAKQVVHWGTGLPCRKWSESRVRICPLLNGERHATSAIYG